MVYSMTAFARKETHQSWGSLSWELRTVNHRYLEVVPRLPEDLRGLEPAVREAAARFLRRGKLDAFLRFHASPGVVGSILVNENLARQLAKAAEELEVIVTHKSPLSASDLLHWPGVLESEELDLQPVQEQALQLFQDGLQELVENRQREGTQLKDLILQRCAGLTEQVERVRARMPEVFEQIRARLRERLAELQVELEPNRLEQEIALIAQRLDVDEEMDRLHSHIIEVRRTLERSEPVGRRLDFLMQELNREANTLASKSSDIETTQAAVEMKVLVEQMREQIQNIE